MPTAALQTIAHISDLHITHPGHMVSDRIDTAAMLRAAVLTILALPVRPLGVLASGDLVDAGSAAEYAHLQTLLDPLHQAGIPLWPMMGNHDEREALRAAFAHTLPAHLASRPGAFVQYAVALPGLRLVLADSVATGKPHGELCAQRLQELDALLAEDAHTPTMLVLHHPPFVSTIGFMDKWALQTGAPELAALLARHSQVKRIACGHIHRAMLGEFASLPVLTCPSTAHQVPFDLAEDGPDSFAFEPAGLLVHSWGRGAGLVSHVLPVGPFEGPYPL
jgi:3',5'-cyclic AMP phosphodiesterase CpdA